MLSSAIGEQNSEKREIIKGNRNMEDHETRRKVIRQWMSLPTDKRQTAEQAADFAKKALEQNELQPSRRAPYERVMGWLLPRTGRSGPGRGLVIGGERSSRTTRGINEENKSPCIS